MSIGTWGVSGILLKRVQLPAPKTRPLLVTPNTRREIVSQARLTKSSVANLDAGRRSTAAGARA
jgi:hypothetical protein